MLYSALQKKREIYLSVKEKFLMKRAAYEPFLIKKKYIYKKKYLIVWFRLCWIIFSFTDCLLLGALFDSYTKVVPEALNVDFTQSKNKKITETCFTCRLHPVMAAGHPAEKRARSLLCGQLGVQPLVWWSVSHPQLLLQKRWETLGWLLELTCRWVFFFLNLCGCCRWGDLQEQVSEERNLQKELQVQQDCCLWVWNHGLSGSLPKHLLQVQKQKQKKTGQSKFTPVPSNQNHVCHQSIYTPLQRHPRLHRQQLGQHHPLWPGLLRRLWDQLHKPDRPCYPGNRGQGNLLEPPCGG